MKAPSSSPSEKRILRSDLPTLLHKGANCFPISRSSSDLDWRTCDIGSAVAEMDYQFRLVNTIFFISGHKVLTLGSCFKYESG